MVEDGRNGILVDPDPLQIAEAILYLYHNEDVRIEMGRHNTSDARKFDWDVIVDRYLDLYTQVSKTK